MGSSSERTLSCFNVSMDQYILLHQNPGSINGKFTLLCKLEYYAIYCIKEYHHVRSNPT